MKTHPKGVLVRLTIGKRTANFCRSMLQGPGSFRSEQCTGLMHAAACTFGGPFRALPIAPSSRRRWVVMIARYAPFETYVAGRSWVFQITTPSPCTFLCRQDADVRAIVHHQSVSSHVCRRRRLSRLASRNECGYSALCLRMPPLSASDQRHNFTTAW